MTARSITILSTAILFGLAACDGSDSAGDTQTSDTTAVVEDYTGQDYSLVVSAEEVRNGVAFGDLYMGNPDAPVTVIEYASLTCSHCAAFHMNVFPDFKEQFIKTGKVRLVYRNMTRSREDLAVGMLARCVGPEQAFDLMSIFYERQRQWAFGENTEAEINAIARRVGINRADFDACQANTELQQNLVDMVRAANAEGVNGTPTFYIGDDVHVGEIELAALAALIEDNM